MKASIVLIVGEVYYLVGYHDVMFQQPCIATVVYRGLDLEGKYGHLFQCCGSGDCLVYEIDDISNIVDKTELIHWLNKQHSPKNRATEYKYEIQE